MAESMHNLLQLLEPAVRPGNVPGPSRAPKLPVERQSFEQMLSDAATEPADDAEQAAGKSARPSALPGLDRVENTSVTKLIAARRESTVTEDNDTTRDLTGVC